MTACNILPVVLLELFIYELFPGFIEQDNNSAWEALYWFYTEFHSTQHTDSIMELDWFFDSMIL